MEAGSLLGRFVVLHGLQWLPTGLAAPVLVLLPHQRGVDLAEIGAAFALYNAVVIALELPTGGWADRWGARPVLLASAAAHTAGLSLLLVSHHLATLVIAAVALGVARALGSGPLESWIVTRLRSVGAGDRVATVLARAAMIEGAALAVGALTVVFIPISELGGVEALAIPVAVAIGASMIHIVAVAVLLRGARDDVDLQVVDGTPVRAIIAELRSSVTLRRLLVVVALNAVALVAVEMLWQPRFQQLFRVDEPTLLRLLGLVTAAGYATAAAGAWLSRHARRWRWTSARISSRAQLLQATALTVLALAGQPLLASAAFLVAHFAVGAFHPAVQHQLHGLARDEHRATMVSAGSLTLQVGAIGSQLTLTTLAGVTSIPTAWLVAAVIVLVAATLQARTSAPDDAVASPEVGSFS